MGLPVGFDQVMQEHHDRRGVAAEVQLSKQIFDNPIRYEYLLQSYSPMSLGVAFGLSLVITAAPTLFEAATPSITGSSFAAGFDSLRTSSIVMIWGLCMLQLPFMLMSGYYLRSKNRQAFSVSYWIQSMLQFTWLQLLAFYTVPMFPLIGVALLFGLFFGWVFNDCLAMYDARHVKLQYLLAFPIFNLMLLVIDLAGGDGLIYAWTVNSQYFFNVLALQLALVMLTQAIISVIGRHIYDHDLRLLQQSALLQELAGMRSERAVLEQTWGLLAKGLTASRFSHDINSVVMLLQNSVDEFRRELGAPGIGRHKRVLAPNWSNLDMAQNNLIWSVDRIDSMARELASSVRREKACEMVGVDSLVTKSLSDMKDMLRGHQITPPEVLKELEQSGVSVTDGHTSAIANLLSNGVQQAPGEPIEVRGISVNEWYYLLSIRDRGVSPEERPEAVRNIVNALSLDADEDSPRRSRHYAGYGLGLMMAKILVIRYDGWVGVSIPDEGPGIVMNIVLPRCNPREIPKEEKYPERVMELMGIDALNVTEIPTLDLPSSFA